MYLHLKPSLTSLVNFILKAGRRHFRSQQPSLLSPLRRLQSDLPGTESLLPRPEQQQTPLNTNGASLRRLFPKVCRIQFELWAFFLSIKNGSVCFFLFVVRWSSSAVRLRRARPHRTGEFTRGTFFPPRSVKSFFSSSRTVWIEDVLLIICD